MRKIKIEVVILFLGAALLITAGFIFAKGNNVQAEIKTTPTPEITSTPTNTPATTNTLTPDPTATPYFFPGRR